MKLRHSECTKIKHEKIDNQKIAKASENLLDFVCGGDWFIIY